MPAGNVQLWKKAVLLWVAWGYQPSRNDAKLPVCMHAAAMCSSRVAIQLALESAQCWKQPHGSPEMLHW